MTSNRKGPKIQLDIPFSKHQNKVIINYQILEFDDLGESKVLDYLNALINYDDLTSYVTLSKNGL